MLEKKAKIKAILYYIQPNSILYFYIRLIQITWRILYNLLLGNGFLWGQS